MKTDGPEIYPGVGGSSDVKLKDETDNVGTADPETKITTDTLKCNTLECSALEIGGRSLAPGSFNDYVFVGRVHRVGNKVPNSTNRIPLGKDLEPLYWSVASLSPRTDRDARFGTHTHLSFQDIQTDSRGSYASRFQTDTKGVYEIELNLVASLQDGATEPGEYAGVYCTLYEGTTVIFNAAQQVLKNTDHDTNGNELLHMRHVMELKANTDYHFEVESMTSGHGAIRENYQLQYSYPVGNSLFIRKLGSDMGSTLYTRGRLEFNINNVAKSWDGKRTLGLGQSIGWPSKHLFRAPSVLDGATVYIDSEGITSWVSGKLKLEFHKDSADPGVAGLLKTVEFEPSDIKQFQIADPREPDAQNEGYYTLSSDVLGNAFAPDEAISIQIDARNATTIQGAEIVVELFYKQGSVTSSTLDAAQVAQIATNTTKITTANSNIATNTSKIDAVHTKTNSHITSLQNYVNNYVYGKMIKVEGEGGDSVRLYEEEKPVIFQNIVRNGCLSYSTEDGVLTTSENGMFHIRASLVLVAAGSPPEERGVFFELQCTEYTQHPNKGVLMAVQSVDYYDSAPTFNTVQIDGVAGLETGKNYRFIARSASHGTSKVSNLDYANTSLHISRVPIPYEFENLPSAYK